MIIGGVKGGGGKSTIAINLTTILSGFGKRVLLVDADELQSSYSFVEHRLNQGIKTPWKTEKQTGKLVGREVLKEKLNWDEIIIDVGGRDTQAQRSAMAVADIMVLPIKPRNLDLWTLEDFDTIYQEMGIANPNLKIIAVLNQADARGVNNQSTIELLKDYPYLNIAKTIIRNRIAFGNSVGLGLGVTEMQPQDKKAVKEIMNLYEEIYGSRQEEEEEGIGRIIRTCAYT